jgi:two-component system, chemotaxis family, protein-glutamate methylesterase/glutaminase
MSKRVLIVDDSPFVRRILRDWLTADPEFEVAGVAEDGQQGVEMAKKLRPDLITLDVEMPRMNGIQALAAIMKEAPCPVIMVSSVTKQGAAYTLEALELGAVDFVTKPDGPSSIRLVHAKDELLEKCRVAIHARRLPTPPPLRTSLFKSLKTESKPEDKPASPGIKRFTAPAGEGPAPDSERRPSSRTEGSLADPKSLGFGVKAPLSVPAMPVGATTDKVVVVASSTGGPRALTSLFSHLPKGFPAPILIVQHMPAGFTESFAKRLDQLGTVPVREAKEGDRVIPGQALIAPGGVHMEVSSGGVIKFSSRPTLHGVRPAADYLFHSACSTYGRKCLAVVLTGMGRDGADGALAIRKAGGYVLGESEESCIIYGMPRAAKEVGAVMEEHAVEDIAQAIVRRLGDRKTDAA